MDRSMIVCQHCLVLNVLRGLSSSEGKQCGTFLLLEARACDVGRRKMLCVLLGILIGLPPSLFVQLHFDAV